MITSGEELGWLRDCGMVFFDVPLSAHHHVAINEALQVNAGDTIYMSLRGAAFEVGLKWRIGLSNL